MGRGKERRDDGQGGYRRGAVQKHAIHQGGGSAQNPGDGRQCDVSSLPGTQTNASGVVEVCPSPVIVDLYAPTQLGVVDEVGKPCVRTLRAVEIPGRDDFAVRIDDSERNHASWLSRPIGFQSLSRCFRCMWVYTAARASVAPAMLFRCEMATSTEFCPGRAGTLW